MYKSVTEVALLWCGIYYDLHIENREEIDMSNWIRVSDIEPSVNEPVLCIGSNDDGEFLSPVVASLQEDGKFIIGYRFNDDRVIGFFFETFPTHWMSMPSVPEEIK